MLKELGREDSIPKENSGDLTPSADSNAVESFTTLVSFPVLSHVTQNSLSIMRVNECYVH